MDNNKPDFCQLYNQWFSEFRFDSRRQAVFNDCLEHVWNTYVLDRDSKIERLESENTALQEKLKLKDQQYDNTISERNELYHKAERLKIELKESEHLKELADDAYLNLKKENEELKSELKLNLPNHCITGQDEVKFCHIRQGDGWKCVHCAN